MPALTPPITQTILASLGTLSRRLPPSRTKNRFGRALAYALGDLSAVPAQLDEVTFWLRPAGRTESGPFWSGVYEDDLVASLKSLTDDSTVFYDIGANVGLVGLRIAQHLRVLGGGRAILFEPVPANARLARRSISANGLHQVAELVEVGLHNRSTKMSIEVEGRRDKSGNATLFTASSSSPNRYRSIVEVSLEPLDRILNERHDLPLPDLVKIDIEGAEPLCIEGAMSTIRKSMPVIYVESAPAAFEFLRPLDYRVFAFASASRLVEVTAKLPPGDVFFVPPSRFDRFMTTWSSRPGGRVDVY